MRAFVRSCVYVSDDYAKKQHPNSNKRVGDTKLNIIKFVVMLKRLSIVPLPNPCCTLQVKDNNDNNIRVYIIYTYTHTHRHTEINTHGCTCVEKRVKKKKEKKTFSKSPFY